MCSQELTVRDLMTPEVVTISMDHTLEQAQKVFEQRRFHHLIVLEKNKPVGVISDRDLLKNISPFVGVRFSQRAQDVATLKKKIHQIMTRRLVSIGSGLLAIEAARRMMRFNVSCLPVIDGERLVGIITARDLLRCMLRRPQPVGV